MVGERQVRVVVHSHFCGYQCKLYQTAKVQAQFSWDRAKARYILDAQKRRAEKLAGWVATRGVALKMVERLFAVVVEAFKARQYDLAKVLGNKVIEELAHEALGPMVKRFQSLIGEAGRFKTNLPEEAFAMKEEALSKLEPKDGNRNGSYLEATAIMGKAVGIANSHVRFFRGRDDGFSAVEKSGKTAAEIAKAKAARAADDRDFRNKARGAGKGKKGH
ncbi:hypothetical protein A2716_01625 [candidate division WWE3 bacterium RIFCSPHIGHO2_01_FULL_40_23]|uniref:Uncharacterized protein n=1 Tax=candidate division WWE3 bacterium RIFCSPLOWO2_01_FULL_41_18 TaxID=1802625 RepID=A0A1F4VG59_UNCKA|nr:MAG: hypothetical protein A2716_01625 [candidate division WWE3 bacterium RIFCSPHIGHO2_01_FULL_40_23]OGC55693.1 MAG: hypothetical protein A3A78_01475 [candidate division WWE3 bacterium RIFCSPLOWO2_01_FULL_41_18]